MNSRDIHYGLVTPAKAGVQFGITDENFMQKAGAQRVVSVIAIIAPDTSN